MDIYQTRPYARYMTSLGWRVERINNVNIFVKKILFFYLIKIQRYHRLINAHSLHKYRPILSLKLEPLNANLIPVNFPKSSWNLLPTKTIILDTFHLHLNKKIRYEIRKAQNSGVVIYQQNDLEGQNLFVQLWHQHARNRGFWVPLSREIKELIKAFNPNSYLFFAQKAARNFVASPPNTLAGALVLISGNTANYMHAFSTPEGRKVSAPYLVLAEIINFCRQKKIRHLDLQGIYDERFPDNNKSWRGFSYFKKQWGGQEKEYPGSYSPPFFWLVKNWLSIFMP